MNSLAGIDMGRILLDLSNEVIGDDANLLI